MKQIVTKHRSLSLGLMGGLVFLLVVSIGLAWAAGESISSGLVSSGGGEVSAEGLRLRSAVGQPAEGVVGEDGLILCSGHLCGPGTSPPVAGSSDTHAVYLPFAVRGH
jgi:hypothetical protein